VDDGDREPRLRLVRPRAKLKALVALVDKPARPRRYSGPMAGTALPASPEVTELRRERDYYRSLLQLGGETGAEPLLREALGLLVDLVQAREGYIELIEDDAPWETPRAWYAHGCDARRVEEIRSTLSQGIIAEAIATGEIVLTASARQDPRFSDRESVRNQNIEAVVCAPVGRERPAAVVYLQGMGDPSGPGLDVDVVTEHVEFFAQAVAPVLENLSAREREAAPSPVAGGERGIADPFSSVIGRSAALRESVERLRLAAPLDVHVLLTGPTGSGKTMLAQATHAASRRAAGPFVELNCAALPEGLLENELFGAERGAHSAAAAAGVRGKVTAAEGGTLFLDEIGELSASAQAKLLQLLQSRTYYPLGASEPKHADIRIVAATHLDLAQAVKDGRFREDLYYRLDVLRVRVPPLSEREEDLVPLAAHFVHQAARRHDLPAKRLSPSALRAITYADWPGNVRELAHRLESAVLDAHLRGSSTVSAADLFPETREPDDEQRLQEATRRFQRRHVLGMLESTNWNVTETARKLDVARSHVYNLIKLHGLRRDDPSS
jgi:Nif-specific regulatory protein